MLVAAALLTLLPSSIHGQGCVAARGTGICTTHGDHIVDSGDSQWEGSFGYRWLHSDRHFTGDHEDRNRIGAGNQVVNDSHYFDIDVAYHITPRYSLNVGVPFSEFDRSQTIDLNTTPGAASTLTRYHNGSGGLGDIRIGGDMWIFDNTSPRKWNVLVGLGFDLPTGEADQTGFFPRRNVVNNNVTIVDEVLAVDQSVQPGDGGFGITLSTYFYYELTEKLTFYTSGSYTVTPQERSDTLTGRGRFRNAVVGGVTNTVPVADSLQFEKYMSIADSYLGRMGLEYTVLPKYGLTFSLGPRIEGVPVYDLVGGSDWFRRPGYSISVEPGIMAQVKGWRLALYAPYAFYNNRERSVPDLQNGRTASSGRDGGDAAFADYQILFSVARFF
jgi:hypothetical protein